MIENLSFKIKIKKSKLKLILIITKSLCETIEEIKIHHKYKKRFATKKEINQWRGVMIATFENNNLLYILVERNNEKIFISTLIHEIFHATGRILRKVDVNYYEDEESYANLNGALCSIIISKLIEFNETFTYKKHKDIKIKRINDE